jgi:hypothetical protein
MGRTVCEATASGGSPNPNHRYNPAAVEGFVARPFLNSSDRCDGLLRSARAASAPRAPVSCSGKTVEGPPGPPGPAGKQGDAGKPGPDGHPGVDGQPGRQGPAGSPGPAGANGTDGRAGAQGIPGHDGKRGPLGNPGQDGELSFIRGAHPSLQEHRRLIHPSRVKEPCVVA